MHISASKILTILLILPLTNIQAVPQSADEWFIAGQTAAKQLKQTTPPPKIKQKAKNVILFIGDGMGISTITAARILDGQQKGVDGEYNRLSFEQFPYTALSVTANANYQTADSASTATALVTGVKTNDGAISVNQTIKRSEANAKITQANKLQTIFEQAKQQGKAVGVVTTTRITHATPAVNYAHIANRDWEADVDLPKGATVIDIASQLVSFPYADGVNVALGGGRANFMSNKVMDPEYESILGRRNDGKDLIQQWKNRNADALYVLNKEQFAKVDPKKTNHLLGLFEPSHMRYAMDRGNDKAGEPSLADMTTKAIQILQENKQGYFLVVEGGRIDHGHHENSAYNALNDTIAFSAAVAKAQELVNAKDTLIVVTADHSHVLTLAGYSTRGNPILGKSTIDGKLQLDAHQLPYTTLSYANGPSTTRMPKDKRESTTAGNIIRPDLNGVDTAKANYKQEVLVPLVKETHGGEDVAIFAKGPDAYLFHGVLEQNVVYHLMAQAMGFRR